MSDCPARNCTYLSGALLALALLATGCPSADVVISIDKQTLSFTRAEVVDLDTTCDDPGLPSGTCGPDQETNPELHLPGPAVRKVITVANNSSVAFQVTPTFETPDGEPLAGAPFQIFERPITQLSSENPDDGVVAIRDARLTQCINGAEGEISDTAIELGPNSELEFKVFFCGSDLGVTNARLRLVATPPENQAESVGTWTETVVLQGDVDCVSLGWDEDMDGFCSGGTILSTDPDADCDDTQGNGHRANPGIEEETCEYDATGALDSQVDNDCDGFRVTPIDEDGDGVCSFRQSCVVEGDADLTDELEVLCGSSEDDCLDGEADCIEGSGDDDDSAGDDDDSAGGEDVAACIARAPTVFPGNTEVCEPGGLGVQLDNDCDATNSREGMVWYVRDEDQDGYGVDPAILDPILYCGDPPAAEGFFSRCIPPAGQPQPTGDTLGSNECQLDCNDGISTVFPGAEPLCDGVDTDCDGVDDPTNPPANPPAWWNASMNVDVDADNDGRPLCSALDCDDNNNDVFVGAAELCDGADNNCDQDTPDDELDDDADGYVECAGVPPTAQVQVAGQPAEELVLFASPALSVNDAASITVEILSGSAEDYSEDVNGLAITLTFDDGNSTTSSLNQYLASLLALPVGDADRPTLISLVIGNGDHLWTQIDEQCVGGGASGSCPVLADAGPYQVSVTPGGDCNDDPNDPAAPAINPGASELNGAGLAICDGQDNDCDGIRHPNETDDDLDGYAECSPSADVDPDGLGGELLTITGPASPVAANTTLVVQTGGAESVTEVIATRTITLTFVDGVSTTSSLAATISAALSGLTLAESVDGTGSLPWEAALAGTYTLVNIEGGDCNDSNPEINLAWVELCDGLDNDCDGNIPAAEIDDDQDGFVECNPNSTWLNGVVIGAAGGNDCEDDSTANPFSSVIYPGAPELADSYFDAGTNTWVLVDNQCPGDMGYDANGIADAGEYCAGTLISPTGCVGGSTSACYSCIDSELDLDGDNYSPAMGDCDDSNDQVNGAMLEICDGFDNDCDGVIPPAELDVDGDDYMICNPAPGVTLAGTLVGGADCDDTNGVLNPGATEIADGMDNDCNELTNDPAEVDDDGDGVTEMDGDCDDQDPTVWEDTVGGTSAPEICDELDNDCDGLLGDGTSGTVDEFDDDGDGYTVCDPSLPTSTTVVNDCLEHESQITAAFPGYPLFGQPNNYPANAAAVHPTAPEVCDGWDTDCSSGSFVTSATVEPLEFDDDGDDYVDCFDTADGQDGWTLWAASANNFYRGANDCADVAGDTANAANPSGTSLPLTDIYPSAPILCDGWDNDCTGTAPPFVDANSDEFDDDGDRYLECEQVAIATGAVNPAGQTILGGYDCLDDPTTEPEFPSAPIHPETGQTVTSPMAASVNPGASEVCDGWNTDCDINGTPTVNVMPTAADIPGEMDNDNDEFIECDAFVAATGVPGWAGEDCLDVPLATNAYSNSVNPAANEVCDSWDTDCDSQPAFPANDGLPEDPDEIDDDGDAFIPCDFDATAIANGAETNGYGGIDSGSDCLDELQTVNDYSEHVNPDAPAEVCDSYDTDCDSQPAYPNNDGFPENPEEVDDDGDGYIQCTFGGSTLANNIVGNGYGGSVGDDDCLDVLLTVNPYSANVNPAPATVEVCDGWNTDCAGEPNYPNNDGIPFGAEVDELDEDGDLYIQCGVMVAAAQGNGPNGEIGGDDCLDVPLTTNAYSDSVNPDPGTVEVCDSWDTDCSNQPAYPGNDGLPHDPDEIDDDGDGYIPCDYTAATDAAGAEGNGYGGVEDGSDCLDVPLATNSYSDDVNPDPSTTEVCDGWDTDCDSQPAYPSNAGNPEDADELDQDVDGYIQCDMVAGAAGNGPNGVYGSDCLDVATVSNPWSDDVHPNTNPSATAVSEVCDGWDTDCDSQAAYPSNDGTPEDQDELDQDVDGYIQCDMVAGSAGNAPNGELGSDCLDVTLASNSYSDDVNPGEATEVCDSWDTDCSNQPAYPANDGAPHLPEELDDDGDNYVNCWYSTTTIANGAVGNGYDGVLDDNDCLEDSANPYSASVNPGQPEVCDGWDTNCDSQSAYPANTGLPEAAEEEDDDNDGYVQCDMVAGAANNGPNGEQGSDCLDVTIATNPYSPFVNPGQSEVCDSWDTNCDSQPSYPNNDGEPENSEELDQDGDGFVECTYSATTISNGALNNGYLGAVGDDDCLDVSLASNSYSDNVNTAATEVCDGWDTDCSNQGAWPANTGLPHLAEEEDDDSDGFIECDMVAGAATNGPNGESGSDCLDVALTSNSYSGSVNPGTPSDVCDGWDTDCSNQAAYPGNDGLPHQAEEEDDDGDGYIQCDMVAGASGNGPNGEEGSDCLDVALTSNSYSDNVHPISSGTFEVCDGWDTDCNSQPAYPANDGTPEDADELDEDSDGYIQCDMIAGSAGNAPNGESGSDCLDNSTNAYASSVNPGVATDVCDGWDTDCSHQSAYPANDGSPEDTDEQDQDADGYVECASYITTSGAPGITDGDDCLDDPSGLTYDLDTATDPAITTAMAFQVHPTASEACDGFSTDCGGGTYLPTLISNERDNDDDDYMQCGPAAAWTPPGLGDSDCDDTDTDVNPGEPTDPAGGENLVDNDCDGTFDEDAATGAVALTEFMVSTTSSDSQWIEIYNASGRTLSLHNWTFDTTSGASFTFTGTSSGPQDAPLQMAAGTYEVLCVDPTNGTDATGSDGAKDCLNTAAMTGFTLADGADTVTVSLLGSTIDTAAWSSSIGTANNRSATLEPTATPYLTTNNTVDLATSDWCEPQNGWNGGTSRRGSPGKENQSCNTAQIDFDGDGYCANGQDLTGPGGNPDGDCNDSGETNGESDCLDDASDPYSTSVNSGISTEACDGYDTDCDNSGTPPADENDDDGDGYIECSSYVSASSAGFTDGDDCRDVSLGTDSYSDDINPNASEACDGYDTDCSSGDYLNEPANEQDDDSDGYAECSGFVATTTSGLVGGLDCRDVSLGTDSYSNSIRPGLAEVCDGYDTDCSTGTYTNAPADEEDDDGDGYVECTSYVTASTAGFTDGDDCRDVSTGTDSYSDDINPGVTEVCDGYDTDCSTGTYTNAPADEEDDDGDGYVECASYVTASTAGFTDGDDCRDVSTGTDSYSDDINPGESEECDGYDTDCSSGNYLNEPANEQDDDGDGHAECSGFVAGTTSGLTGGLDCRDVPLGTDAYSGNIRVGFAEVCDGYDTDCSSGNYLTEPADEQDDDGDGFAECSGFVGGTTSGLSGGSDCLDVALGTNAYSNSVFPGATEACDGYDTDCTGGLNATGEEDDDLDTYLECANVAGANIGGGFTNSATADCLDVALGTNAYSDSVFPGATEACDGYDTDCTGGLNATDETDGDSDLYLECANVAGADIGGGFTGGGDCDDGRNYVFPTNTEVCDGYDNDCSGTADFTSGGGLDDELDGDSDGYVECTPFTDNDGGAGFAGGEDCDDATATTFPFAGDSAAGGGDTDCDGLDCIAGDGLAGTAYSTGPYFVYCAVSGTQAAAVTACEVTLDGSTMRLAEVANSTDNGEIAALMGATAAEAWLGGTDGDGGGDGVYRWDAGTENSDTALGFDAFGTAPTDDSPTVQGTTTDESGVWFETDPTSSADGYVCELP